MENKLLRKSQKVLQRNKKKLYQSILSKKDRQSILFIVGCQRSGTSMLLNIFDRDLDARCFGEFSELSASDTQGKIRLNSFGLVQKEFAAVRAPFIVAKPLVESQNVLELLDTFPNSKALWMFRNFRDVASSNIKHFGIRNGINDIKPIVTNEPDNWRSENVSAHVRETISRFFSEDMPPYDAAVLFWFARNSLYFDLELDQNPRVMLSYYEDFVLDPAKYMQEVYRRVGQPYPGMQLTADVHSRSRKKGKDIELSPEVEQIAQGLQDRLIVAYKNQPTRLNSLS